MYVVRAPQLFRPWQLVQVQPGQAQPQAGAPLVMPPGRESAGAGAGRLCSTGGPRSSGSRGSGAAPGAGGRVATTSPRPAYSWRSRCLEPVGLSSQVSQAARQQSWLPFGRDSSRDVSSPPARSGSQQQRRSYVKPVTRPRTPPLQTRERSRQKLVRLEQEQSLHQGGAAAPTTSQARRGTAPALHQPVPGRPSSPPPDAPLRRCGSSPPGQLRADLAGGVDIWGRDVSAADSRSHGGSPSTVPQVLSEASTSPAEAPSGASPEAAGHTPRQGRRPAGDENAGCGPRAPQSWEPRGALTEVDTNSPQRHPRCRTPLGEKCGRAAPLKQMAPGIEGVAPAGTRALGAENRENRAPSPAGPLVQQTLDGDAGRARLRSASPAARTAGRLGYPDSAVSPTYSDDSANSCISFNMSPLARVSPRPQAYEAQASPSPVVAPRGHMAAMLRNNPSTDTLAFTASGPPSRVASNVPSRRNSLGDADSLAATSPHGAWQRAAPAPQREAAEWAKAGEAGKGFGAEPCKASSKVAQMCSLWEQKIGVPASDASLGSLKRERSSIASSGGALSSAVSAVAPWRGAASGRKSAERSTAWLRCSSDMVRRLRHEEERTSKLTGRLMERLRELDGGDTSPPLSPTVSGGSSPSISDAEDEPESPTTQMHHQMMLDLQKQVRTQRQLSRAFLRVVSLDKNLWGCPTCPHCRSAALGATELCAAAKACKDKDVHCMPDKDNSVVGDEASTIAPGDAGRNNSEASLSLATTTRSLGWRSSWLQQEDEVDASVATTDLQIKDVKIDMSRRSARGSIPEEEPAREPQPKESPRTSGCASKAGEHGYDHLEGCGPAGEPSAVAEPSHEEPGTPPAETSTLRTSREELEALEASSSRSAASPPRAERSSMEGSPNSVDTSVSSDSFDASLHPRAGEEGMPRVDTILHALEQSELQRQVMVVVPEGMGENRMVSFYYENRKHDVVIPEGYEVGQEVPILVPKRPPLERNPASAVCRGHQNFLDRMNIVEPLKHSSRVVGNCSLDDPEFRHRHYLYTLLRGTNMNPLLAFTPEEDETGFEA